jgi:hypothetical protein
MQYVTTEEWGESDRYILARMKQKTLALVFRLNYSVTPNLSIQYYGQPFVAAGDYKNFKRVTQPRAENFQDRYHSFSKNEIQLDDDIYRIDENSDGKVDYSFDKSDFNFRQFLSNLVMRWEYKPGSTIYFVWSQGRTGSESMGNFAFKRDMTDLFDIYPQNVFLVKFNHWFSL